MSDRKIKKSKKKRELNDLDLSIFESCMRMCDKK